MGVEAQRPASGSEAQYRELFERAVEGLFICTPDGVLLLGNRAMAALFGYPSFAELAAGVPRIGERLFADPTRFAELATLLGRAGFVRDFDFLARREPSDSFWGSITAEAAHDVEGHPTVFYGSVRDITAHKTLELKLLRESSYDATTGLVNRAMFLNHLDRAIARARRQQDFSFALVSLDIDRFRSINEMHGHSVGDELLGQIARVLSECLRTEDICARLGSDEFALFLSDVQQTADVLRVVERVNVRLEQPLRVGDKDIYAPVSSGVVLSGEIYGGPEEMLRDAEAAMYRAKTNASSSFDFFDNDRHRQAVDRLKMEAELRSALPRDEFRVYYQPIVSLRTGVITAFEALVRWERPGVGLVMAQDFVPLLEETRLIVPTGDWVLRTACEQLRSWQQSKVASPSLMISVNVSAKQLESDELVQAVERLLGETGLEPGTLKLEITESAVMRQPEQAIALLTRLRALGVTIGIDDFGTGYSSLAYLHRFPVDVLKIDKSFIRGMKDRQGVEIVRAIIGLAQNLDKRVIAEGVETTQQLSKLMELQCEFAQGYSFSRPVNAREAESLLRRGLPL